MTVLRQAAKPAISLNSPAKEQLSIQIMNLKINSQITPTLPLINPSCPILPIFPNYLPIHQNNTRHHLLRMHDGQKTLQRQIKKRNPKPNPLQTSSHQARTRPQRMVRQLCQFHKLSHSTQTLQTSGNQRNRRNQTARMVQRIRLGENGKQTNQTLLHT